MATYTNEEERRALYKQAWRDMKLAEKKSNFNKDYWEHEVDKYRKVKKFAHYKSKTKEYHREQSRKTYARNPKRAHKWGYKWAFNSVVYKKKVSPELMADFLNLIESRLDVIKAKKD